MHASVSGSVGGEAGRCCFRFRAIFELQERGRGCPVYRYRPESQYRYQYLAGVGVTQHQSACDCKMQAATYLYLVSADTTSAEPSQVSTDSLSKWLLAYGLSPSLDMTDISMAKLRRLPESSEGETIP